MKLDNIIQDLFQFIDGSPTPYHCVESVIKKLNSKPITEQDSWTTNTYKNKTTNIVVRNKSSFVAFKLPEKVNAEKLSFRIIASHTDSPCLKLKIKGHKIQNSYQQWGTEVYGGSLINTWLDRDLYVAGLISYIDTKGKQCQKLIKLDKQLFRIPQLAIHLDRNVNEKGLLLNKQKHLIPIIGLENSKNLLNKVLESLPLKGEGINKETLFFDLSLCNKTPSSRGGVNEEFIYAPRLDNQAMCHASLAAFLNNKKIKPNTIPIICSFDHEEVGSESLAGASSNFLGSTLKNICRKFKCEQSLSEVQARSLMISADMAHAVHPNYSDMHDPEHLPLIGSGPVIKSNSNMRYASTPEMNTIFAKLCLENNVPFQNFVSRSDIGCGSTIGPMTSSQLGIRTIDVGNPMLSMHSSREMSGVDDHLNIIKVFSSFLEYND
jgi:aspartyl aminopeptidase